MGRIGRRSFLGGMMAVPFVGPAVAASASGSPWVFQSIDGGPLDLRAYRGGPVLVVNTASRCFFTPQYDALQAIWDSYRVRGLTVVGVPSDSFKQELASDGAVKDFCEANFSIDFPMTTTVDVVGRSAHPFYLWAAEQGYRPRWNFYKLLLDGEGRIVTDFGTWTKPDAPEVLAAFEPLLPRS